MRGDVRVAHAAPSSVSVFGEVRLGFLDLTSLPRVTKPEIGWTCRGDLSTDTWDFNQGPLGRSVILSGDPKEVFRLGAWPQVVILFDSSRVVVDQPGGWEAVTCRGGFGRVDGGRVTDRLDGHADVLAVDNVATGGVPLPCVSLTALRCAETLPKSGWVAHHACRERIAGVRARSVHGRRSARRKRKRRNAREYFGRE